MRKLVLAAFLPFALSIAYVCTVVGPAADAAPGKNLLVYPRNTDTKVLKADMKKMAKALGVQCDFCHDVNAMEKDTNKHKVIAREMMKMTAATNATLVKAGLKQPVTCNTCHAGQKKPKS